jgi:hypothetical protein
MFCQSMLSHMNLRLYSSFDVDMPTEVDDEYWENEHDLDQAFKQPPGKPSLLSYFISFIKLNQTLAVALRTIVRHASSIFGVLSAHFSSLVFD